MAFPEELVEEVLLRLPPAEPACLFRAAIVCKLWRRLVSEPRFRRRYREFHRFPPTLGFVCSTMGDAGNIVARFVPAVSSGLPHAAHHNGGRRWWRALGVCHGRVLLHGVDLVDQPNPFKNAFVIWNPITDHTEELPLPLPLPPWVKRAALRPPHSWNAALVCAAAGQGGTGTGNCDHLDCHGQRPFLVVLVVDATTTDGNEMFTYVYSSEVGAWGHPTEHPRLPYHYLGFTLDPSVFVGNALHFLSRRGPRGSCIFRYDLGRRQMFVIRQPVDYTLGRFIVLMAMEDGRLGFATMESSKLCLWSRSWPRDGRLTNAGWAVSRVIDLKALLPAIGEPTQSYVVGCAGNAAAIFVFIDGGIFTVDVNSSQIAEVCRASWPVVVFPYLTFYTPVMDTESGQVAQVLVNH